MRTAVGYGFVFGLLISGSVGSVYGQNQSQPAKVVPGKSAKDAHEGHDHSKGEHEAHGPHDGELLEVGKEEYHVELCVNDEKKQVVVFLLDSKVESYVALTVPFVAVNAKVKGKPVQFKLKAMPQKDDKPGSSSAFGLEGADLVEAIHDESSEAKLALKIADKPYSVKLKHDHDHAGHDHEGHDHKKK
ncbi:MAG: hypothetical protein J0M26_28495 [Planctomycetes bacterium]|nr:hypothetical protein [Planctomycetota bacterium]